MNIDKKISFRLLALTSAKDIDTLGNIKKPYQNPIYAKTDRRKGENTPAIVGFLLAMSIMAGVMAHAVFFIFSFFLLIILFGVSVKKHNDALPENYSYVDINQTLCFEEDRISHHVNDSTVKKEFLYTEIKSFTLFYIGITPPNAKNTSIIQLIKKGEGYEYRIWIDSQESKQQLINALKILYDKKIPIKEYTGRLKSYLLMTGDVTDLSGLDTMQALIDEIGTKEDSKDTQML